MKIINTIFSTLFNKCPRCHHGEVFSEKNPYKLGKIFSVNETCSHCGLKYQKEPDFFYGALYVSYALTSGWFTIWFLLYNFVLNIEALTFALLITLSLIVLSPLTIRWSRLIWLNFFFKYDKKYSSIKIKQQSQ